MAKIWRELLDVSRHRDHFHAGSWSQRRREHEGPSFSYFVQVAGFTFELASVEQIRVCLAFFEMRIHPSSRTPVFAPESGEWQAWHERLPARMLKGSKRPRRIEFLLSSLGGLPPQLGMPN